MEKRGGQKGRGQEWRLRGKRWLDFYGLNGFCLKLIAMASMLIDHTAAVMLVPGQTYLNLRTIGRIAFPIFCFLLAEGVIYTHSLKAYAIRLAVFAAISEIPYDLAFQNTVWYPEAQNVFFTLLLAELVLWFYQWTFRRQQVVLAIPAAVAAMMAAELLHTDYGAMGICMVLLFYFLRDWPWWKYLLLAAFFGLTWWGQLQVYALMAFPLFLLYNRARGPALNKYIFYGFYPAHLLILWGISCIL